MKKIDEEKRRDEVEKSEGTRRASGRNDGKKQQQLTITSAFKTVKNNTKVQIKLGLENRGKLRRQLKNLE